MVGEGIALVIAPEDLLGDQVIHAAALEQLGQRGGVPEGIRQPQQAAVHPQLLLEKALAEHQLANQRLAGGHVGIRLHVHGAFGNPAPLRRGTADFFIQGGVVFPAHLVGGGLALQEAVLGVALQQAQLRGEGAGGFAVGFPLGPQPGQVQVRVAHGPHAGHGGAVFAGHEGTEQLPGRPVAGVAPLRGLLKVHRPGEGLQAVGDLRRAEGVLGELVQEHAQGAHVQPELIGVLIPDAEGVVTHAGAAALLLGIAQGAGEHRAGGAAAHVRIIMPGVHLKEQVETLAGDALLGEHVVGQVMMGDAHPFRPAGAEGLPVDKQGGFAAHVQGEDHGLVPGLLGQHSLPAHPHVFPGMTPGGAFRNGAEGPAGGLLRGQVFHGGIALQGDFAQGAVEILRQHPHPVIDAGSVFRVHQRHGDTSRWT